MGIMQLAEGEFMGRTREFEHMVNTLHIGHIPLSIKIPRLSSFQLICQKNERWLLIDRCSIMNVAEITDPEVQEGKELLHILPNGFSYIVEAFDKAEDGFCATFRLAISNKEEALRWLAMFEEKSLTTFRVERTYPENTNRIVFKKEYRCQHNTRPASHKVNTPHEKHTGCGAKLSVTVKQQNMKRSKDPHLNRHPCKILLRHTHNHEIKAADAVRHRTPTKSVEAIFKHLFTKGHSPSTALQTFKIDLQQKYPDNYHKIVADRSRCPSAQWCYHLYYTLFKRSYEEATGPEMVSSLNTFIIQYNEKCKDKCAALSNVDGELTIAICTPLMKHVHQHLRSAGEVVFIDSSGNMEHHSSCIFLVMCASMAGALPLGIVITYSEAESSILEGFTLLKTLFPEKPFYGMGNPEIIIITDDCQAERNSLRTVFPSSNLLLCIFHVLQAFLRFLQNSKNGVHKDDQIYIFKCFQKLVHCETADNFESMFNDILEGEVLSKYEHVKNHLRSLRLRSVEWALCYRQHLLTRGNTNNYVEASFCVVKDKVLNLTKGFSIVQIFDFLTNNYEQYYIRKLSDIVNNRFEGCTETKYHIGPERMTNLTCEVLAEDLGLYKVVSGNNEYVVNQKLEICTCPVGFRGAPCKHQSAVAIKYNLSSNNFSPKMDSAAKEKLHLIMAGDINKILGWYNSLQNKQESGTLPDCSPVGNVNKTAIKNFTDEDHLSEHELEDNISKLRNKFEYFGKNIIAKLEKNPPVFYYAIDKFLKRYDSLKTDPALVSAFHSFASYSGAVSSIQSVNFYKNLKGGKIICVQPSAVARRTVVGGSHCLQSERPPKTNFIHTYGKRKRAKDFDLPFNKK